MAANVDLNLALLYNNSPKLNTSLLKELYHFLAGLVSFQAELINFVDLKSNSALLYNKGHNF